MKLYVFKSARKKAHPINVGVYEEFPVPDDDLEWRKTAAEGSISSNLSLWRNANLGTMSLRAKDKEPVEEEKSIILLNTADCEKSVD